MARRYAVGARVDGLYDGNSDDVWYPGHIQVAHEDDETYGVLYDDGESEHRVGAQFLREHVAGTICVGTRVFGRYAGGDEWFPGRIMEVLDDGTFTIEYDDGEVEACVVVEFIKESLDVDDGVVEAVAVDVDQGEEREAEPVKEAERLSVSMSEKEESGVVSVEAAEAQEDATTETELAEPGETSEVVRMPTEESASGGHAGIQPPPESETHPARSEIANPRSREEMPPQLPPRELPVRRKSQSKPQNPPLDRGSPSAVSAVDSQSDDEYSRILSTMEQLEANAADALATKTLLSALVKQMRAFPQASADLVHSRGGEDLIIDILKLHHTHAVIQCYGFVLLRRLCFLCGKSTHFFLRNGIIDLVAIAMRKFAEDAILQASACGALAVFTRVHAGLSALLENRVSHLVLATIIFHKTYSVHTRQVHYYACEVLLELCELGDKTTIEALCGDGISGPGLSDLSPVSLLLFLLRQALSFDDKKACCAAGTLLMCLASCHRHAAQMVLELNGLSELSTVMAKYSMEPGIQKYAASSSKEIALCSMDQQQQYSPTKRRVQRAAHNVLGESNSMEGLYSERLFQQRKSGIKAGKGKTASGSGQRQASRGVSALNGFPSPANQQHLSAIAANSRDALSFSKYTSPIGKAPHLPPNIRSFADASSPSSALYHHQMQQQRNPVGGPLVILNGQGHPLANEKKRFVKEERQNLLFETYGVDAKPSLQSSTEHHVRTQGIKRRQLKTHIVSASTAAGYDSISWASPVKSIMLQESKPLTSRSDKASVKVSVATSDARKIRSSGTASDTVESDELSPATLRRQQLQTKSRDTKRKEVVNGVKTPRTKAFELNLDGGSGTTTNHLAAVSPKSGRGGATSSRAKVTATRLKPTAKQPVASSRMDAMNSNASTESLNSYAAQLFKEEMETPLKSPTAATQERERLSFAEKLHKMIDKAKSSLAHGSTVSLAAEAESSPVKTINRPDPLKSATAKKRPTPAPAAATSRVVPATTKSTHVAPATESNSTLKKAPVMATKPTTVKKTSVATTPTAPILMAKSVAPLKSVKLSSTTVPRPAPSGMSSTSKTGVTSVSSKPVSAGSRPGSTAKPTSARAGTKVAKAAGAAAAAATALAVASVVAEQEADAAPSSPRVEPASEIVCDAEPAAPESEAARPPLELPINESNEPVEAAATESHDAEVITEPAQEAESTTAMRDVKDSHPASESIDAGSELSGQSAQNADDNITPDVSVQPDEASTPATDEAATKHDVSAEMLVEEAAAVAASSAPDDLYADEYNDFDDLDNAPQTPEDDMVTDTPGVIGRDVSFEALMNLTAQMTEFTVATDTIAVANEAENGEQGQIAEPVAEGNESSVEPAEQPDSTIGNASAVQAEPLGPQPEETPSEQSVITPEEVLEEAANEAPALQEVESACEEKLEATDHEKEVASEDKQDATTHEEDLTRTTAELKQPDGMPLPSEESNPEPVLVAAELAETADEIDESCDAAGVGVDDNEPVDGSQLDSGDRSTENDSEVKGDEVQCEVQPIGQEQEAEEQEPDMQEPREQEAEVQEPDEPGEKAHPITPLDNERPASRQTELSYDEEEFEESPDDLGDEAQPEEGAEEEQVAVHDGKHDALEFAPAEIDPPAEIAAGDPDEDQLNEPTSASDETTTAPTLEDEAPVEEATSGDHEADETVAEAANNGVGDTDGHDAQRTEEETIKSEEPDAAEGVVDLPEDVDSGETNDATEADNSAEPGDVSTTEESAAVADAIATEPEATESPPPVDEDAYGDAEFAVDEAIPDDEKQVEVVSHEVAAESPVSDVAPGASEPLEREDATDGETKASEFEDNKQTSLLEDARLLDDVANASVHETSTGDELEKPDELENQDSAELDGDSQPVAEEVEPEVSATPDPADGEAQETDTPSNGEDSGLSSGDAQVVAEGGSVLLSIEVDTIVDSAGKDDGDAEGADNGGDTVDLGADVTPESSAQAGNAAEPSSSEGKPALNPAGEEECSVTSGGYDDGEFDTEEAATPALIAEEEKAAPTTDEEPANEDVSVEEPPQAHEATILDTDVRVSTPDAHAAEAEFEKDLAPPVAGEPEESAVGVDTTVQTDASVDAPVEEDPLSETPPETEEPAVDDHVDAALTADQDPSVAGGSEESVEEERVATEGAGESAPKVAEAPHSASVDTEAPTEAEIEASLPPADGGSEPTDVPADAATSTVVDDAGATANEDPAPAVEDVPASVSDEVIEISVVADIEGEPAATTDSPADVAISSVVDEAGTTTGEDPSPAVAEETLSMSDEAIEHSVVAEIEGDSPTDVGISTVVDDAGATTEEPSTSASNEAVEQAVVSDVEGEPASTTDSLEDAATSVVDDAAAATGESPAPAIEEESPASASEEALEYAVADADHDARPATPEGYGDEDFATDSARSGFEPSQDQTTGDAAMSETDEQAPLSEVAIDGTPEAPTRSHEDEESNERDEVPNTSRPTTADAYGDDAEFEEKASVDVGQGNVELEVASVLSPDESSSSAEAASLTPESEGVVSSEMEQSNEELTGVQPVEDEAAPAESSAPEATSVVEAEPPKDVGGAGYEDDTEEPDAAVAASAAAEEEDSSAQLLDETATAPPAIADAGVPDESTASAGVVDEAEKATPAEAVPAEPADAHSSEAIAVESAEPAENAQLDAESNGDDVASVSPRVEDGVPANADEDEEALIKTPVPETDATDLDVAVEETECPEVEEKRLPLHEVTNDGFVEAASASADPLAEVAAPVESTHEDILTDAAKATAEPVVVMQREETTVDTVEPPIGDVNDSQEEKTAESEAPREATPRDDEYGGDDFDENAGDASDPPQSHQPSLESEDVVVFEAAVNEAVSAPDTEAPAPTLTSDDDTASMDAGVQEEGGELKHEEPANAPEAVAAGESELEPVAHSEHVAAVVKSMEAAGVDSHDPSEPEPVYVADPDSNVSVEGEAASESQEPVPVEHGVQQTELQSEVGAENEGPVLVLDDASEPEPVVAHQSVAETSAGGSVEGEVARETRELVPAEIAVQQADMQSEDATVGAENEDPASALEDASSAVEVSEDNLSAEQPSQSSAEAEARETDLIPEAQELTEDASAQDTVTESLFELPVLSSESDSVDEPTTDSSPAQAESLADDIAVVPEEMAEPTGEAVDSPVLAETTSESDDLLNTKLTEPEDIAPAEPAETQSEVAVGVQEEEPVEEEQANALDEHPVSSDDAAVESAPVDDVVPVEAGPSNGATTPVADEPPAAENEAEPTLAVVATPEPAVEESDPADEYAFDEGTPLSARSAVEVEPQALSTPEVVVDAPLASADTVDPSSPPVAAEDDEPEYKDDDNEFEDDTSPRDAPPIVAAPTPSDPSPSSDEVDYEDFEPDESPPPAATAEPADVEQPAEEVDEPDYNDGDEAFNDFEEEAASASTLPEPSAPPNPTTPPAAEREAEEDAYDADEGFDDVEEEDKTPPRIPMTTAAPVVGKPVAAAAGVAMELHSPSTPTAEEAEYDAEYDDFED